MNHKGFAPLLIIVLIAIIALIVVGIMFAGKFALPGKTTPSLTPSPTNYEAEATDSSLLKTEYKNPFEEESTNPFDSYKNPFSAL